MERKEEGRRKKFQNVLSKCRSLSDEATSMKRSLFGTRQSIIGCPESKKISRGSSFAMHEAIDDEV